MIAQQYGNPFIVGHFRQCRTLKLITDLNTPFMVFCRLKGVKDLSVPKMICNIPFICPKKIYSNLIFVVISEPQFRRFQHIWKHSKKLQTPQQTQKVKSQQQQNILIWIDERAVQLPGTHKHTIVYCTSRYFLVLATQRNLVKEAE